MLQNSANKLEKVQPPERCRNKRNPCHLRWTMNGICPLSNVCSWNWRRIVVVIRDASCGWLNLTLSGPVHSENVPCPKGLLIWLTSLLWCPGSLLGFLFCRTFTQGFYRPRDEVLLENEMDVKEAFLLDKIERTINSSYKWPSCFSSPARSKSNPPVYRIREYCTVHSSTISVQKTKNASSDTRRLAFFLHIIYMSINIRVYSYNPM